MTTGADIRAGRLAAGEIAEAFADLHPPLGRHEARVEAERCLFCYDAPCVAACPTGIDIPLFIRQIATGNALGAAQDDPRRQHLRRHVRPRLPDRDPLRGGLRPQRGGGQADRDRTTCSATPPTPLMASGRQPYRAGLGQRAAGSPSSAPGRPGSPAPTGSPRSATRSSSSTRRAQARRSQRARHRLLQDGRRFRPARGRLHPRRRRHRAALRRGARPRLQPRRSPARLRRGLPRPRPAGRERARPRRRRPRGRRGRRRLHRDPAPDARTSRPCRSAAGSWSSAAA